MGVFRKEPRGQNRIREGRRRKAETNPEPEGYYCNPGTCRLRSLRTSLYRNRRFCRGIFLCGFVLLAIPGALPVCGKFGSSLFIATTDIAVNLPRAFCRCL